MAEATDLQMQQYCDQRIRPRAETLRAVLEAITDDKAAGDSVYERAVGANPWADARTDGPPTLLNQNAILVFNTVITALSKCIHGTATAQDVTDLGANWTAFQTACVRPTNQA